jgi:hypothetical protein
MAMRVRRPVGGGEEAGGEGEERGGLRDGVGGGGVGCGAEVEVADGYTGGEAAQRSPGHNFREVACADGRRAVGATRATIGVENEIESARQVAHRNAEKDRVRHQKLRKGEVYDQKPVPCDRQTIHLFGAREK